MIPGDPNRYCFGCIATYNIVVVCLPDRDTSTNFAATVAARILIPFLLLKFGLIVDIGSSILQPFNFDIRLGNIVVSSATDDIRSIV